jgi:hypothetical protein
LLGVYSKGPASRNLNAHQGHTPHAYPPRCQPFGQLKRIVIPDTDLHLSAPDSGVKESALLKKVAQAHSGMAGVYGAVLVEGTLHKGDSVDLLN